MSSRNGFFHDKEQIHETLLSIIFTIITSFSLILEDPGRGRWSRAWSPSGVLNPDGEEKWLEEGWMDPARSTTGCASGVDNRNLAFMTMRASFMIKDFLEEMGST